MIFYHRADIWYGSLHVDPGAGWFPHYAGYAGERGAGAGEGRNRNLPLAPGTADDGWLAALDALCAEVRAVGAEAVVVSLGLDAAASDPESPLRVTEAATGRRVAGSRLSGRRCSSRKAGMTWPRWAAWPSRRSREPPRARTGSSASSRRATPAGRRRRGRRPPAQAARPGQRWRPG